MSYQYSLKKSVINSSIQKLTFFEYFTVLVFIIYAGNSNTFVRAVGINENPVAYLIPLILSIIIAIRWKVLFANHFFNILIGIGIYWLAISIKYHEIHVAILLNYFTLIFIVYSVVNALKFNLFKIYEYLIYYLAIIGLIFWIIQILLGGDSLYNLFSKISVISLYSYEPENSLNALIYSVQPLENILRNKWIIIPRNCGYAWEPGAFAVYLCLAIFINLFISKSDKKSKIRFWILVSALITTQSTTGFIIFITIVLFYYANKKLNIILLALPVIITTIVYIFSLPFMGNKIFDLVNESSNMDEIVENSINNDDAVNPQRFVSFMIAYKDFLDNPILGIGGGGGSPKDNWTAKIGANISIISGIGNLLAQNGIIGFLFFIILSIKSSILLSQHYNYKGKLLLFIIIIFISISYYILLLPLIGFFWMFSFFDPIKHTKRLLLENKSNIIRFD